MRGGVDGALQLGDQFGNGAVQVASDATNGPPVARLLRMNPNSLKQHGGGDVLVLKQGRIVERGTHTQLLEADGTYAELYRQFVKR